MNKFINTIPGLQGTLIYRIKTFWKKPSYVGAKFFNVLPDEIKELDTANLKKNLKLWLMAYPFYSISEFFNWRDGLPDE